MANSDVCVNGTHIGNHPYGYVSFRYDVTSSVPFGSTDNVLAVKTDTARNPPRASTPAPASTAASVSS